MFSSLHSKVSDLGVVLARGGLRQTYRFGEASVTLDVPEAKAPSKASPNPRQDRTGNSVWPAALVLGNYLAQHFHSLPAGPCVELGSGIGLCGITVAKLGKHKPVICTDPAVDLMTLVEANALTNGVDHIIQTAPLLWGDREQIQPLIESKPAIIIGADLLYTLDSIPALMSTISDIGAQTTLLALKPRHFGSSSYHSEELLRVSELADHHGLQVKRVAQEGTEVWDCVQVLELTSINEEET
jgi:hypothetical protein